MLIALSVQRGQLGEGQRLAVCAEVALVHHGAVAHGVEETFGKDIVTDAGAQKIYLLGVATGYKACGLVFIYVAVDHGKAPAGFHLKKAAVKIAAVVVDLAVFKP